MALLEKQLVVRTSSIPGSGKGLFTKKPIPKGTLVVEYIGTVSTWKDVDHDEGNNGYIYYLNRNHVLNAQHHLKALARYANDARGLSKVKGLVNNCHYVSEGKRVFIETLKDIPANGEIFVSYGPEYWQVIKHNMKIDADAEKERLKKEKADLAAKAKKTKKAGSKKAGSRKVSYKKTTTKKAGSKKAVSKKAGKPSKAKATV